MLILAPMRGAPTKPNSNARLLAAERAIIATAGEGAQWPILVFGDAGQQESESL